MQSIFLQPSSLGVQLFHKVLGAPQLFFQAPPQEALCWVRALPLIHHSPSWMMMA